MFMNIEYKKGNASRLDGRMTVYARIVLDPAEVITLKHPIAAMIHNGLLVAQGNFRDQNNLRDFLKSEMGLSFEEGLEAIIDKLDGLESALDPQKLRDKMQDMAELEEFIPTPAKIVPFHSEADILRQEGDVFYTGTFKNIGNANLSVNAFPILYQARYREQQIELVRDEIEQIIGQIERPEPLALPSATLSAIAERILKEFIPNMLYGRNDPLQFENARQQFLQFADQYHCDEDSSAIVAILKRSSGLSGEHYKLLELYARKIAEQAHENITAVQQIQQTIITLRATMPGEP